ncbi:cyd operon YbgE family protein [Extensimonas perlucida]|jgi:predicted membrane protein|uniref:cyd operon YbgE family protein n=1 Tax=Extensimonas perlucida TaxID=2590786 RepID=UPI0011A3A8DB|nr:cyd operon YbgE family protein [Extensimonas perlucida]
MTENSLKADGAPTAAQTNAHTGAKEDAQERPLQPEPAGTRLHWPCLLVGLAIMLGGSAYPLLFTDAAGRADHGLAMLLLWAMSAGLVRGVGFVPRAWPWRVLFSGPACTLALGLAAALRFML